MASTFKTPGVYVKEISTFPPSVAQVETAIPAFIGYTEIARKDGENLTNVPTRISSLLEYTRFFGGPQPEQNLVVAIDQKTDTAGNVTEETFTAKFNRTGDAGPSLHNMYYSLQIYFANGGGPCYIVSVGEYLPNFRQTIGINPMNDGLEAIKKEDEPTLIVFPEGQSMAIGEYHALIDAALAQCNQLQDRFVIFDTHHDGREITTAGDVINDVSEPLRSGNPPAFNGVRSDIDFIKYGAAYFPNILSIFNYVYDPTGSTVTIEHNVNGGSGNGDLNGNSMADLDNVDKSKASLAIDAFSIFLPPSPAMAGVYARVDSTRGVWKAPANENVLSISGVTFKITDEIQDSLNVDPTSGKSINAIRAFAGKGTLVWGARTLAGNDNEWRYISVRRFFNMVEESTKKATQRFVFEPNDANTWVRVKAMIENFLVLQWRAGALAGAVPEDAFFVNVGLNETMTALDILEGRMIVEIGMAVVRPAEFIILKFSHKMQES